MARPAHSTNQATMTSGYWQFFPKLKDLAVPKDQTGGTIYLIPCQDCGGPHW